MHYIIEARLNWDAVFLFLLVSYLVLNMLGSRQNMLVLLDYAFCAS